MPGINLRGGRQILASTDPAAAHQSTSSSTNNIIIGFDMSGETDRKINEDLCKIIMETGVEIDDDGVDLFIRNAFSSGAQFEKFMCHIYWIALRNDPQLIADYSGIFMCRLVERRKLSNYMVVETLWNQVIPALHGLGSKAYSQAVKSLARFLREVFYDEVQEDSYTEADGVLDSNVSNLEIALNPKIEYIFCWWNTVNVNKKSNIQLEKESGIANNYYNRTDQGTGEIFEAEKLQDPITYWKQKLQHDCYLDILAEFLNLIQHDALFADALGKLIEFQIGTFRTILGLEYCRLPSVSNRDYVKMESISCSYTEITDASKLLRTVTDEPKLHKELFFITWYIPCDSTLKFKAAGDLEKREVLKINLYYLARILKDFDSVLTRLTTAGIITCDDVNSIKAYDSQLEKAVILFMTLMAKDPENLPLLVHVMKETNNKVIADILETDLEKIECEKKAEAEPKIMPMKRRQSLEEEDEVLGACGLPSPIKSESSVQQDFWSCVHCTFNNFLDLTYCEQCCRSRCDFDENEIVYQCQLCTYINDPGVSNCKICEHALT